METALEAESDELKKLEILIVTTQDTAILILSFLRVIYKIDKQIHLKLQLNNLINYSWFINSYNINE